MKVLVIGASGMIGSTMLHVLSEKKEWNVSGTIRDRSTTQFFSESIRQNLKICGDVENQDSLISVLDALKPNVIINCVGLIKHKPESENPLASIPINTLMPHRLSNLCNLIGARLIHISTDCVFSGNKGHYVEDDFADAYDIYGKSKALGEIIDVSHVITLRTSTIGHELQSQFGLLDWFLSQQGQCKGFKRAVFSGLPTIIFAKVIRDIVIPHNELSGLYHIGATPIDKFRLLKLIASIYGKKIDIIPDDKLVIDRSLDSTKFNKATGYNPQTWPEMIKLMYSYK